MKCMKNLSTSNGRGDRWKWGGCTRRPFSSLSIPKVKTWDIRSLRLMGNVLWNWIVDVANFQNNYTDVSVKVKMDFSSKNRLADVEIETNRVIFETANIKLWKYRSSSSTSSTRCSFRRFFAEASSLLFMTQKDSRSGRTCCAPSKIDCHAERVSQFPEINI